jgi:hypothetical protein
MRIVIYYRHYYGNDVLRKYLTTGIWNNINFSTESSINPKEKVGFSFKDREKIIEKYKKQIELEKSNLKILFQKHLQNNKEELMKILNKRIKQVETQSKRKEKNDKEKSNKLQQMGDILLELGYQVSKVVGGSGYYGDYYVKNRKVNDKYHKYIETESKNIKFATIEVKINQQDYKIGFKVETIGQIGCDFEELEKVYNKLKTEKEILEDKLLILKNI